MWMEVGAVDAYILSFGIDEVPEITNNRANEEDV